VIPPGALYGPRPIMEMMGVEHWFQPQAPIGPASPPVVPPAPRPEPAPKPPVVRKPLAGAAAEPGGTSQAWKWLGYGDAHFAAEKYDEALRRYQRAAEAAPKLADTHFRQGFALAVLGQYAAAAAAFKRGLELNPAWPKSKFRLAELYDGNELAKTAHLDALARAAEEEPRSGEKFFIFGVWLHFDGQAEKARTAFQRAAQLAQGEQPHLSAFLGKQNCIPGTRTDIDNLEKIL
jgi:tetratricopeptide (TPR) repeat protein